VWWCVVYDTTIPQTLHAAGPQACVSRTSKIEHRGQRVALSQQYRDSGGAGADSKTNSKKKFELQLPLLCSSRDVTQ
jgi:hypothetical protein